MSTYDSTQPVPGSTDTDSAGTGSGGTNEGDGTDGS